jgi:hypothetical protein
VLRTHLEIERAMIRTLEAKFPNYSALKHNSFAQHIRSLRALGASGPIFQIADQVNKTRNELAHVKGDGRSKLSETDLKQLCSQANGAFGRDVLRFNIILGGAAGRPLQEFPLGQQFAIIGFMAAAAIDTIPQRELVAQTVPD